MKNILFLLMLIPTLGIAEIHKEAQICPDAGQICFLWWPKLPEIKGWHHDIEHSHHYKMNTQAPDNFSFANAEAVIYARAEYQDGSHHYKNIDEFISFSQKKFINGAPSKLEVAKTGKLESKGKIKFISYSFFPEGAGNWEQVSYGEEKDADGNTYFLIFVLSSRSKNAYDQSLGAYNEFINQYK